MTRNIETLFEEHKHLINSMIWRNRRLLAALRLESEDVAQELSIVMLSAIKKFDPEQSKSLAVYITYSLQYEILNMKRRHKPHGVTGIPKDERINFLYMDNVRPDGNIYELPSYDDTSGFENSEMFDSLSEPETETLELKMNGFSLRQKAQTKVLTGVRRKYTSLYENERRVAA